MGEILYTSQNAGIVGGNEESRFFKKPKASNAKLSQFVGASDRLDRILVMDFAHNGPLPNYAEIFDKSAYDVTVCNTLEKAFGVATENVIVSLVHIPENSTSWIEKVLELHDAVPHGRQILMTANPVVQAPALVELCKSGTLYDFHQLPLDCTRLVHTVGHIRGLACLERRFQDKSGHITANEPFMVGESTAMKEVFKTIRRFGAVESPVLITGESGTGKELAARALHERSHRSDGPFIAINCASLPPTLIESELFGYERGAFTGATQRKPGRLELADGGTLFLDEMGDLPPEVQAHFLRFLQEGTIERLGGTQSIKVDARIIAATHVDLEAAVADTRFREDLFYRLNVLRLQLPALRERSEDIELLARFFLKAFSAEQGRRGLQYSKNALIAIRHYGWPGNIRELISAVRRAVVMTDRQLIHEEDLGIDCDSCDSSTVLPTLADARAATEVNLLSRALKMNKNNILKASREIGISRVSFYRLLKKHRLSSPPDSESAVTS